MREQDIVLIARFIKRPHSLTGSELQTSITSFIAGYEIGTDLKCNFTELLSLQMEKKYKIEKTASGWPKQITVFAEREKQSWLEAFKAVTLVVLEAEINRISPT